MDLATILGLVVAFASILGGQALEGGHIGSIMQGTAAMIVLGGTAGAVMVSFPMADLKSMFPGLKTIFAPKKYDMQGVSKQLVDFATQARQNGIIAIEKNVAALEDAFMKKALTLAVDGSDSKTVRATMELELSREEHEVEVPPKVFEAGGGYAPTVGILGAVLGLIHVMENLSDPSKLGSGIATAFVATVYGVGFANLFCLPMANKLKMRGHELIKLHELVIEGVVAIVDGENPRIIKEKLDAFQHGGGHDHADAGAKKAA